jgi:preprotein translocase subunit SecA
MEKSIFNIKTELGYLKSQTNEELEIQIEKLKKQSKKESLESIIEPWFAMVQEVSYRKIGLRHFDTQLMAGLLLHQGKIVEMKTGEGKTLASTLSVSLNALSSMGTHVVTVNEYLAERDQKWMGKVYNGLNLSVGLVKNEDNTNQKRKSYAADITYVTNSELVFDYLRDSTAYSRRELVQRPLHYCVIDEIDSILIDEARTPLIISMPSGDTDLEKLKLAESIVPLLQKNKDFQIDEKQKDVNITEDGYKAIGQFLGKKTLFDPKDPWILTILNALKAEYIFKLNKDYIVLNNKVMIVDEFTGRIMEDRRWSQGIHEAIENKEKVEIGSGTVTKSGITYQNFFTLYPKLGGMTGTAKTTEKEFQDIYNLPVVVLPTSKPLIRKDLSDFVFQTELAKWKAVLNQSKDCYSKGQPVLIGTATVEKSEFLSDLFAISNIPHQVLNAKPENVGRESEIVAQAGTRGSITIATNMAGRGTDIILGGNPYFIVKTKLYEYLIEKQKVKFEFTLDNMNEQKFTLLLQKTLDEYSTISTLANLKRDLENLPYSFDNCCASLKETYDILYNNVYANWVSENKKVKELGGLFVIGTERHETRRIDNQLRGRSGRQGDPGVSQFFVSLEDDIIKVFGGDNIKRFVEFLVDDKDSPLESDLLTNSLENAQQKIELYNYDLRKNVFQYDDVLNFQRHFIYNVRKELLCNNIPSELITRIGEAFSDEIILAKPSRLKNWYDYYATYPFMKQMDTINLENPQKITKEDFYKEIWISQDLRKASYNVNQEAFLETELYDKILRLIDDFWTAHIERMNNIRETITWKSYGQLDPLVEYNFQAEQSFKIVLEQINENMLYYNLVRKKPKASIFNTFVN